MTTASVLHPRGVLMVAGACFVALTAAVVALGAFPADTAVRDALLALATPWVVTAMRIVNRAGDWRVLLPGTLLLFVVFRRARERWWLWVALMAIAPLLEWALKHLVGRTRPEDVSLSFPSGHSTAVGGVLRRRHVPGRLAAAARPRVGARAGGGDDRAGRHGARDPARALALRRPGGIALGLALAAAAGLMATRSSPGRHGGPDMAPKPPDVRRAPAEP